jgi:catechol 2,3-dioxygenase-like lactoylglutathione lyase family enzyme
LFVENLERSIDFYGNTLELKLGSFNNDRRIALFWIGEDKQFMLGLWEKPKHEIEIRHFAFQCNPDWILNESVSYLNSRNINYWNFLNDDTNGPMVFVWMPAISIYFSDPDGHELEFIGILEGETKSNEERRVITYNDWLKIENE